MKNLLLLLVILIHSYAGFAQTNDTLRFFLNIPLRYGADVFYIDWSTETFYYREFNCVGSRTGSGKVKKTDFGYLFIFFNKKEERHKFMSLEWGSKKIRTWMYISIENNRYKSIKYFRRNDCLFPRKNESICMLEK